MTAKTCAPKFDLRFADMLRAPLLAMALLPVSAWSQTPSSEMSSMPAMRTIASHSSSTGSKTASAMSGMMGMDGMADMPSMGSASAPASSAGRSGKNGVRERPDKLKPTTSKAHVLPAAMNMHGMPMPPERASRSGPDMASSPGMGGMGRTNAQAKGTTHGTQDKADVTVHSPATSGKTGPMGAMPGMQGMSGMHASKPSGAVSTDQPMNTSGAMGDMPMPTEGPAADGMKGMPGMSAVDGGKNAPSMPRATTNGMDNMDMGSMTKSMQGGAPPIGARDPDAYSDGLALGPMPGMDMMDDAKHWRLLVNRLEAFRTSDNHGSSVDAQAWVGGDVDKLWMKVDGEAGKGTLGSTRTEALWAHSIATYWDTQVGLRHDFGDGPVRNWAAIGLQGLAPYWFDVQATAYLGQSGRTALRLESDFEILLTQRLILQPEVKLNFYGKSDPARKLGAGLSDVEGGLRLRYEISRKFAPYLGVVWTRQLGRTAVLSRAAGESAEDTQIVAGVRLLF